MDRIKIHMHTHTPQKSNLHGLLVLQGRYVGEEGLELQAQRARHV